MRAAMAMKTAMSASVMDFKEFFFAMSARILAIGYTPTHHDSGFLGAAARAYYNECVLRTRLNLSTAKTGCAFSWGRSLFAIRSRQLAAISRGGNRITELTRRFAC
jgi:hypothetical protein